MHLCGYNVTNGNNTGIPIKLEDTPNYVFACPVSCYNGTTLSMGMFGYYSVSGAWKLWNNTSSASITGNVYGVVTWVVE